MARKLITNCNCPLCGNKVEEVPDAMLKKKPHHKDAELVVTKTGIKQYIHSSCWHKMIADKRPYDGRLYI